MDDLYDGWDGLDAGVARLVSEVLEPLSEGRAAHFVPHDWTGGEDPPSPIRIEPTPVLVVEGCGSAARAVERFEPVIVWMDGPQALRMEAAIARDGEDERADLERWEALSQDHFARESTKERADLRLER
jgi:hypothetical protein